MTTKRSRPATPSVTSTLMPLSVDVDLVRFEKNLLQIGFFGANDARDKNRTSRRIEQIVFRNGHKIKVAAEFRGSELLGLPSTTDRDKFIALLKIISEDRARTGRIENPIRFSGYRLIQELGLSRNGEIYEEILRWGKRMTDTTITSEQVVYRAAKKVYSDEVLHVFRSFRRTGSSNLNGTERQEHYEVVLEDWLLENLNQRYVIPEDFNAYKQLARPTAKGIFGNLHLWFHASHGRQVEKSYAELCNLLNVQAYPHLSKIRSTMGLALNELVKIRYISQWDVQPMSTRQGYKIVLQAGEELLRVLDLRSDLPADLSNDPSLNRSPDQVPEQSPEGQGTASAPLAPSAAQQEALTLLARHGITPAKAAQMLGKHGADTILETVEYLESQLHADKQGKVGNPAGLIIYSLENDLPVPAAFIGASRRRQLEQAATHHLSRQQKAQEEQHQHELSYRQWIEARQQEALEERYPAADLDKKLTEIVASRVKSDELFHRVPARNRKALALQLILREIRNEMLLPTFEEWRLTHAQINLF